MLERLFAGTTLGIVAISVLAGSSYGSSSEPLTVDVYGSSYSIELDHDATDQVLRRQPWWGNKDLANELCEALVYEGEDIASIGYNTTEIRGQDYIEAYLVMPLATCTGPIVVAPEDIGEMTGGTFFVIAGDVCITSNIDVLNSQNQKYQHPSLTPQNVSVLNCSYFDDSIVY
ncbi:MAG: hypothetical protein KTR27_18235 [Leptolyngbyaceae cyanobacterium MAG.088]|nr:hypothetical protein [Leptolyngbyaceae cyanobacterium MAG.088]